MNYIAFEAGSRAGLSTELFFRAWRRQRGFSDDDPTQDSLLLVDADEDYIHIPSKCKVVHRVSELFAHKLIGYDADWAIFPADELTRQCKDCFRNFSSCNWFSRVDPLWYDKTHVNNVLSELIDGKNSPVLIPLTFGLSDVFIKPNTASAGSKGLQSADNVCVSQRIDIKREYVVDVLRSEKDTRLFAREVKLRAGYDKYVKLIHPNNPFSEKVARFIEIVAPKFGLFSPGIFHLQIAEDVNGDLFYIEASRRISGTSFVNLVNGFNPFFFLTGEAPLPIRHPFAYGEWYRYEDFLLEIEKLIDTL